MIFQKHKRAFASALALSLAAVATPALAGGGLAAASSGLSTFQVWFFTFVGILAICYLTYKGAMAFTDREHWSDFGMAIGKVAVVGGVIGLAAWAWSLFQ